VTRKSKCRSDCQRAWENRCKPGQCAGTEWPSELWWRKRDANSLIRKPLPLTGGVT